MMAKSETSPDGDQVWSGHGIEIAEHLGIQVQSIHNMMSQMSKLKFISQVVRGSRYGKSVYKLLKLPNDDDYQATRVRGILTRREQLPTKYEAMQQALTRLDFMVKVLDERVERLERGPTIG